MQYIYCCSIIDLTENTVSYKKGKKNLKKIGGQNSKAKYLYRRETDVSNHSFMPVTKLRAKWRKPNSKMLCNMQSQLVNIILTWRFLKNPLQIKIKKNNKKIKYLLKSFSSFFF